MMPDPQYQILQGDCLELMRGMEADSVDVVVTSPPYNTLGERIPQTPTGMHATNKWLSKVSAVGYNDNMSEGDYCEWLKDVATEVARVLRPGGSYFFNHKVRYRDGWPVHPIDYVRSWPEFKMHQEIIWDRRGAFAFNCQKFAPSDERIYRMVKIGGIPYWNQAAAGFLSVWPISPLSGERIENHPCPFPIEIARRCIIAACPPGGLVLDPFCGSGSTGKAALLEGFRFVGCELSPEYATIARARCEHAAKQGTESQPDLFTLAPSQSHAFAKS